MAGLAELLVAEADGDVLQRVQGSDDFLIDHQWGCLALPRLLEAPVFTERRSVGLDVHARSVVAAAIDTDTGVTTTARLTPSPAEVIR